MTDDKIYFLLKRLMDILGSTDSLENVLNILINSLSITTDADMLELLKDLTKEEVISELMDLASDKDIFAELKETPELKEYVEGILIEISRKEMRIEVLVEEPSMKNFLEIIFPKILPPGFELNNNCFIHPHQGKSDLQKSIPKKVLAYKRFPQKVKLIIIHDQDSNDCVILKNDLLNLVRSQNKNQPCLIRIACKELENWYLGGMQSIEKVYSTFKASKFNNKAKYRNPDNVFGAHELQQLVKDFSKGFASKQIPKYMDLENNSSPSFNHLISGVQNFLLN